MQQHDMALQQLKVASLNSKVSQQQHVEALRQLVENGTSTEPSQAPPHITFRSVP